MDLNKDLLKTSTLDNYTTEKVNVISNCLLGDYVDGKYVISDSIIAELVNVKKYKKSVFNNSVFCHAFISGYGDVIFEVTFQKNTVKNIAMADLYVLENEYKINGYIQNTIRTKVSSYYDDLENFVQKTYDHFHILISDKLEKEYKNTDNIEDLGYINAKRNFSISLAKLTQKQYNKLYRKYVTARLELLKNINSPYTNQILEKFNSEYTKIEQFFLKEDNYKAVSELLDKCIEDVTGVNPLFAEQEKEYTLKVTPIINEMSSEAEKIAQEAHDKAISVLNKNDQQRLKEAENSIKVEKQESPKEKKPEVKQEPKKPEPKTTKPIKSEVPQTKQSEAPRVSATAGKEVSGHNSNKSSSESKSNIPENNNQGDIKAENKNAETNKGQAIGKTFDDDDSKSFSRF